MQAVIQYGKIVSWLEMEYGLSEKESKASESFLLAAFLNLAMCYLKLREYTKAVECCDKVKCLRVGEHYIVWIFFPVFMLSLLPLPLSQGLGFLFSFVLFGIIYFSLRTGKYRKFFLL